MIFPECSYTGVYVQDSNIVYIAAVVDELANENIDHSVILRCSSGSWSFGKLTSSLASILVGNNLSYPIAVCIDGKTYSIQGANMLEALIDNSDEGPSDLVHVKDAKLVGDSFVATGMARRVYLSKSDLKWMSIDDGVFVPRDLREEPFGFLSIDGVDESNLYAVGLYGQIWYYNGCSWVEQESPTNVALTVVLCNKNNNYVYVGGMSGLVICGEKDKWEVLTNEVTGKDFWGIAEFKGEVYLSNYDGVFKIVNNSLEAAIINSSEDLTTAYIWAVSDVMYSVGHKHILTTKDGINWTELIPKDIIPFA